MIPIPLIVRRVRRRKEQRNATPTADADPNSKTMNGATKRS